MEHKRHPIGQYTPQPSLELASEALRTLDDVRTEALALWRAAHTLIVGNDGLPTYNPNCFPGHIAHTDGHVLTIAAANDHQKPRWQRSETRISRDVDGNLVVGLRAYRKSREDEGDYTTNRVTNEYTLTPEGKAQRIEEEGVIREGTFKGDPEIFIPLANRQGGASDTFRYFPLPALGPADLARLGGHLRVIQEGAPAPRTRLLATIGRYLGGLFAR